MHIGIDLGGTKTEIICLDANCREQYRKRVPSPQNDYLATIATIVQLITEAEAELSTEATLGIGIPGTVSHIDQRVKNSNSTWINGQPFLQDLQQSLGRELRLENDANCFTLSEAIDGAATGYTSVFGVILGTGCGGGLYLNGKILSGAHGLGGEWGHNPLPFPKIFSAEQSSLTAFFDGSGRLQQSAIYRHKQLPNYFAADEAESEYPGPLCYCGKRGCLETWLSGPGFANDFYRLTGEKASTESIVMKAKAGETAAMEALDRYCERLAKSLAQVINIYDPQVIVLGGGMSNIQMLYHEVPQRWEKYIFSDQVNTHLLPAAHGDSSGVRGAALLWSKAF